MSFNSIQSFGLVCIFICDTDRCGFIGQSSYRTWLCANQTSKSNWSRQKQQHCGRSESNFESSVKIGRRLSQSSSIGILGAKHSHCNIVGWSIILGSVTTFARLLHYISGHCFAAQWLANTEKTRYQFHRIQFYEKQWKNHSFQSMANKMGQIYWRLAEQSTVNTFNSNNFMEFQMFKNKIILIQTDIVQKSCVHIFFLISNWKF